MRTIGVKRTMTAMPAMSDRSGGGARRYRRLYGPLTAAALVLSGSGSAWAASILNEDTKAHTVLVTEGRFRNEMQLAPGEAATEVCAKCQFDVRDVGKVDAQDNDLVVITAGGRIEKRS